MSCKELWIAHSQRLQSITSLGVATPNDYNSLHVLGVYTPNAYNSLHVLEWLLPTITIHYKRFGSVHSQNLQCVLESTLKTLKKLVLFVLIVSEQTVLLTCFCFFLYQNFLF